MAKLTISGADEAIQLAYKKPITNVFYTGTPLRGLLKRNTEDIENTKARLLLQYAQPWGVGARAEDGALPSKSHSKHKLMEIPLKYIFGRFGITLATMKLVKTDRKAFVNALKQEMTGLANSMLVNANRMDHGNGSGTITTVKTDPGAGAFTDLVVNDASSIAVGQFIDCIDPATGNDRAGYVSVEVTGVDYDTNTITAAAHTEAAIAVDDIICLQDSYKNEPMGLGGIIATGDPPTAALQGLAVATYTYWKAKELANSGTNRELTNRILDQAFKVLTVERGVDKRQLAMHSNWMVQSRFAEKFLSDYRQNTLKLKGGWEAVNFNGIPWTVDAICPDNLVYLFPTSNIKLFDLPGGVQWMDDDGSILHRVTDYAEYEGTCYFMYEMGVYNRRQTCLIKDLKS